MKLYSWNVNGIRAAEKKGLVDWIKSEQPDVLGIQELKATEDQLPDTLKQIDGYHAFFNPAERKGYSGTAVYYKEAPLDIHTGLSDDRFNHEGRTIVMEYPYFTLYNIYFPNGGQGDDRLQFKMDFYDCFQKDVNALVAEGKRVIVCGPQIQRETLGLSAHRTGMGYAVLKRRLHRHLPLFPPGSDRILVVELSVQRPGQQRRMAHRLFLRL